MRKLQVKALAANRLRNGYQALEEYDFKSLGDYTEGEAVEIVDEKNKFIGKGYLGKENRTVGWILTTDKDETIDSVFYDRQFRIAHKARSAFYADDSTTAFRLFNADGDGIGGITVDYYAGFYIFSWFNKGIYTHKEEIYQAFKVAIPDFKGIVEKVRFSDATLDSKHVDGEVPPEPLIIKENGIQYATYINEGWMTGIFLDQRNVRGKLMEDWGTGKTILNTFSYTGAFSVAAAMGGAVKTVNIDAANRSKAKTIEQFELNGLNPDDHEIRVIDVFDYLDYAKKHDLKFDMIILDPPTFARTKKRTFTVEKDYVGLIQDALEVLADKGMLIASSNTWKLNRDDFYEMVNEAFDNKNVDAYLLDEYKLPEDFKINEQYPESDYLKVMVLEKTN
ncbi:class I SAM-dependent rRNA methyltransferase [Marinilactibacillus sp. XAAS-LB27]|uniref:class I SAM-dependent rRNA methyltransferase n=1 Tax=Marinilactibacillus sp. XAAS-LB27 TaxID=3114538 RepID=UPI002E16C67F|nr:class I SAM-dependent rRNA methyltransferase [Marinilactibacillus sp. XAAS-LB27]